MIDTILVLNAGSSSLKFQVFRSDDLSVLARGKAVRLGEEAPAMDASLAGGTRERVTTRRSVPSSPSSTVTTTAGACAPWRTASCMAAKAMPRRP